MKKMILLLLLIIFPFNVFAYSNKIIVSGESIGIEVHSNGVYITDFYKVNNEYIAKNQGFKIGDIIKEINNNKIYSIDDLNKTITKIDNYNIKIERNSQEITIPLKVEKEENIIKTGLYVKDQVNGIGTLSYIDPETKVFASLGHEILESTTLNKFKINEGTIYKANVNNINKSKNYNIGEIHASFTNKELGTINKNEVNGIYGKYTEEINDNDLIEINSPDNIEVSNAKIRLTLEDNSIHDYDINIISINRNDPVKNIYFEITDKNLLNKTGGIVQGMSGAPIIQNDKVIGIVNYVKVEDEKKGYGIFIETILEEGDKLLKKDK